MKRSRITIALLLLLALFTASVARAEVKEVRFAKQYGLSYLPLIVMEQQKLVEKHAKAAGLGQLKASYATLGSGAAMNDALLSGSIDYASGGVAPMLTIWGKSRGEVRGVAALDTIPIYLNSVNPSVKGVKDLSDKDKIALPAVKVSIQAVLLQMAAAKAFGANEYDRLDRLTVSMKHPDAMAAILSGRSEVTGHLASPPFMFQELKDKRVRTVVNSYDVLGGPHTFDLVWATKKFHDENPKTYRAVLAALDEAVAYIGKNKRAAAELYLKASGSKEPISEVYEILSRQPVHYTTTPLKVSAFADFMNRTGSLKEKPKGWKDLFFPEIHGKKGS
ncbi:ABC transporter, periplasmic substrate-binding protein, putative [Citrifermentans bemidjiense Bem]|uniref:ABC transporter, periplasmic substrate-binding protein, putative n=1 Tax=Citrifermentans bemidjiense (strain ATCC BAA-1014 / DSM 16622 / JCM 12645 / Bem) TaxID=404380 RepID=B5EA38_CITBB|nr:ABC transporter substrate-binding protein [Citrifermentans bemidjiense]ACH38744.1 ABC transporter, periplasmic substrate-binding protein, putative [Citrifermentans bemidjiense Bem]